MRYRAWDKEIQHMYLSDNKHLSLESNGRCFNLQTGNEVLPLFYIDAKDKNNKDICQGDLVKIPAGYAGDYSCDEVIAEIRYIYTEFYPYNLKEKDGITMQNFTWNETEIIGNIYENKYNLGV